MLYLVTFTINIPPMLEYIPAPWILWELASCPGFELGHTWPYEPPKPVDWGQGT